MFWFFQFSLNCSKLFPFHACSVAISCARTKPTKYNKNAQSANSERAKVNLMQKREMSKAMRAGGSRYVSKQYQNKHMFSWVCMYVCVFSFMCLQCCVKFEQLSGLSHHNFSSPRCRIWGSECLYKSFLPKKYRSIWEISQWH